MELAMLGGAGVRPLRQAQAARFPMRPRMLAALAIFGLAGTLAAPGPLLGADAETRILFRVGELQTRTEKGEVKAIPTEQEAVPGTLTLAAGSSVDPKLRAETVKSAPKTLAAVSLSPREVATLATGASLLRAAKEPALSEYTLSGPVHLLIHGGKDAESLRLGINGVAVEVTEAHLFVDGWKSPARLVVLAGSITLAAPKAGVSAMEASGPGPAAAKAEAEAPQHQAAGTAAGPTQVAAGQTIVLDPQAPAAAHTSDEEQEFAKWSTVAGFEAPGAYQRAGVAVPSDGKLTVKRYGLESRLTGKRMTVLEGDELTVPAGQKTVVQLDSKDQIVLTGEARFKIETFGAKAVLPSFVFSIFGKVRALIAPKDPGAMQFRSKTATVGVKGTDFEALASDANTEVSVLEGKVGVADAAGAGEVDVPAGFFASVAAGGKPTPPKPLPPERLKELRSESPGPTALNIAAPTEGQVLAQGKLEFSVDPPSAAVQALLDDKPVEVASGGALPADLPDGPHKLTVRGTAAGSLSKTVNFTVDRKPPVLDPAIVLASLTSVEGTALVLKWNKPLASAEAEYDGRTFPLALAPDGLSAPLAIDPAVLKESPSPIKLRATDKAGNTVTSDGTLTFKRKPTMPPVLSAGRAEPVWLTNAPTDVHVTADRDVQRWEVSLDGIAATERFLPKPEPGKEAKAPREITLAGAALAALADGDHSISVKATDGYGLTGEYKVTLKLDRAPPAPTVRNAQDGAIVALPAAGAPPPVLKPGTYQFSAGKPLKELRVQLDGQEHPVPLADAKDRFDLHAEGPPLKPGEHAYHLVLTDLAGNTRAVDLRVVVEAPSAAAPAVAAAAPAVRTPAAPAGPAPDREATLRRVYERTVAAETGYPLDQMYLGERGNFVFIPTVADAAGVGPSGGPLYRQGRPESVSKDLTESFMREIQGP